MSKTNKELLSLLSLCSDNKDNAEKVSVIAELTDSSDYIIIESSEALKELFQKCYDISVLENLSIEELKKRSKMLHKVASFNKQLIQCIKSGNGSQLSSKDAPDLSSEKSISRLLDMISLAYKQTNYSNISENNALALFSDNTVKSAQKCFDMLPVTLAKQTSITEEQISQYMGNTLYCIDIDEFRQIHKSFLKSTYENEKLIEKNKMHIKKFILIKIAIIMLCIGAVFS